MMLRYYNGNLSNYMSGQGSCRYSLIPASVGKAILSITTPLMILSLARQTAIHLGVLVSCDLRPRTWFNAWNLGNKALGFIVWSMSNKKSCKWHKTIFGTGEAASWFLITSFRFGSFTVEWTYIHYSVERKLTKIIEAPRTLPYELKHQIALSRKTKGCRVTWLSSLIERILTM